MVKICCIGAGYVGGPSMAVMALKCPAIDVTVVDVSRPRIDAWNSDRLPVLEPGLDAVVRACRGRNLSFSADVDRHVADADIVFVSVNTPTKARGLGAGSAPDLAYWESAARMVAAAASRSRPGTGKIVVEKSAVPVRTAEAMERILQAHTRSSSAFQVLSNPEFFSEGTAVRDLLFPDRVVIGGRRDTDAGAVRALADVYAHWVPEDRIVTTGLRSAELAKLAASTLLAQRVSSVNALSALCEATGADVSDVARAVGSDGRVGGCGRWFLDGGVGFGGPSLRRDVLSLAYACERHGLHEAAEYWRQVVAVNEYQKGRFVRRVVASMLGTVAGKKVAVLGLAFKKGVGDTRESPAVDVCRGLLADGARVSVYDPVVGEKQIRRDMAAAAEKVEVEVARDAYEAADGAHGLCVLTEWDEFRTLDYRRVFDGMTRPAFVFDGRNVVDAGELREIGFVVYAVGKPLDAWLKGLPAVA